MGSTVLGEPLLPSSRPLCCAHGQALLFMAFCRAPSPDLKSLPESLGSSRERNEKAKPKDRCNLLTRNTKEQTPLFVFMPKISAFLFLPWRHNLFCCPVSAHGCHCWAELQLGEGNAKVRLCNRNVRGAHHAPQGMAQLGQQAQRQAALPAQEHQ